MESSNVHVPQNQIYTIRDCRNDLTSLVATALPSFADDITFETLPSGPSLFIDASPMPQTIVTDNTTFTGGVILTAATNLPADGTTIYGTASATIIPGVSGMTDPLTISNPTGFNNFFFDLINGMQSAQTFVVSDNAGNSATFTDVPSNANSGVAVVGFASTGTVVTITDISNPGSWDFFVDNVQFDVPLPPSLGGPSPAPEVSSTAWLLLVGLLGLGGLAQRRRALA